MCSLPASLHSRALTAAATFYTIWKKDPAETRGPKWLILCCTDVGTCVREKSTLPLLQLCVHSGFIARPAPPLSVFPRHSGPTCHAAYTPSTSPSLLSTAGLPDHIVAGLEGANAEGGN